jgi:hypothetical protein
MEEDRFAFLERRLQEIREQERALSEEFNQLERERSVLTASAQGFRVGKKISWTESGKKITGEIAVIWTHGYLGSDFIIGARQDGQETTVRVGKGKKPWPL